MYIVFTYNSAIQVFVVGVVVVFSNFIMKVLQKLIFIPLP